MGLDDWLWSRGSVCIGFFQVGLVLRVCEVVYTGYLFISINLLIAEKESKAPRRRT